METRGDSVRTMVLIDAYSQIFRAFFAVRMLTNAKGEPVNAAFVFTRLLLQLERAYPSEAGAMLFDCGKVKFRTDILPEYKANRPPMPEELASQIPLIKRIAAAFGWPQLQHENWEADDLIGALAGRFTDYAVKIVSSDKDLSQLVDDRVEMLIPAGSGAGFERRGREEVGRKFGVEPELIVDYLSLLGDASDNIPGVAGIGPKGAADLLNTFGPARLWLDDLEKLSASKYYKKLQPQLDTLTRNRELIRLRTELPEDMPMPDAPRRTPPDWGEIAEICRENQFNSILRELPERVPAAPTVSAPAAEEDLFSYAATSEAKSVPEVEKPVQPELF